MTACPQCGCGLDDTLLLDAVGEMFPDAGDSGTLLCPVCHADLTVSLEAVIYDFVVEMVCDHPAYAEITSLDEFVIWGRRRFACVTCGHEYTERDNNLHLPLTFTR
jgi:hypothetical protein